MHFTTSWRRFFPALVGILMACLSPSHSGPNDTIVDTLFNGRDFTGWEIKTMGKALNADPDSMWRVVGGNIEVNYSKLPNWNGEPWSHLYTKKSYSYYLVRFEYQFYGTQVSGAPFYANQNSGIMFHSQTAASMALDQNWPISLEDQLLGPGSTEFNATGNICTPGTAFHNQNGSLNNNHCVGAATTPRTMAPTWTKTSALVLGDSIIKHYVGTQLVLTYYKPVTYSGIVTRNTVPIVDNAPLTQGVLALQSESAPIRFRNIELVNLKGCANPASPNYKAYYVKSDPATCAVGISQDGVAPGQAMAYDPIRQTLALDLEGPYSARVVDLSGQAVWSGAGQGRRTFALGKVVRRGIYFLSVYHAGKTFTQKMVLGR